MRNFETGATRDDDSNKFDYEGFLSPAVLERFAAYMHKNRIQADGKLRASDNWQKGIPREAYMKSMMRHVISAWKHWRSKQLDDLEEDLCAILFNAMGLLFELLNAPSKGNAPWREVYANSVPKVVPYSPATEGRDITQKGGVKPCPQCGMADGHKMSCTWPWKQREARDGKNSD